MDLEEEELPESTFEPAKTLADLFEKAPLLSPRRNELCPCGSGKKYKKCCAAKTQTSPTPQLAFESFEITRDPLSQEEAQETFPPLKEDDEITLRSLYYLFHESPESIDSEECEYFQKLEKLEAKYPDHPTIVNYRMMGYEHLGLYEKTKTLIRELYERFPNYLFAQTAQAHLYLREGSPEKALDVLKGAYTLKQLYPSRNVFHISEFQAFEPCMIHYFCEMKNLEQAQRRLQLMRQLLDEEDPALQRAEHIFARAKAAHNLHIAISRLSSLNKPKKRSHGPQSPQNKKDKS